MNVLMQAQSAYSATTQNQIRSPRAIEYAALAQVTARLKKAGFEDLDNFPELAAALDENRNLWRVLAMDVADDGNGLPADLRARLFYLFEFTDQHTTKVLERSADIAPLVEINTAIMRGLSGRGDEG